MCLFREKTTEQMLDDQDDSRSAHSIGIVENPLYAEQEDYNTPSYADLKEKEVRKICCMHVHSGLI